jgi:tetratricopeptide (TPR) repeat protein
MSRLAAALVILALFMPPSLRAQERDPVTRARELYQTGRLLFDQGDYEVAAKKFAAGYELVPRPQFLLNIGLCYQKLDQLDKSRTYYQRFLDEAPPNDPDREHATRWMAEVDATMQKRAAAAPAPPPAPPSVAAPAAAAPSPPSGASLALAATPPPKRSWVRRNWWIFPVGGAVVAGVAVGIYFAARPANPCSGPMLCLDLR